MRRELVTKRARYVKVVLLVILVAPSFLAGQAVGTRDAEVTAVKGESWLKHLRRSFNESSMGRTWDLGPAPPTPGVEAPRWQLELSRGYSTVPVTLHGSDLYRLNCQGCHGGTGGGAPPEINSVINPVRATSVAVILERTKKTGQDMSRADATLMAKQAKDLLLKRLHEGGEAMPAFPQLNETEIRSIVAYLEELSDVPGANAKQIAVKETPVHVGEQIVKSTCHVCHGASGPNPDNQQLMDGAIPPLGTLTTRTSLPEFVKKVTNGACVTMGAEPLSYRDSYRGRMPVFRYLSQDEAADAYLYLTLYPPQ
jgi:mono/diheme cytochrome c family protein